MPILLIHGLVKNKNDMNILKRLIQRDYPDRFVETVEILFGTFSTVVEMPDRYARALATAIKQAVDEYNEREHTNHTCVTLIGHSQGGFLARAYTQMHSNLEGFPRVYRIYSIAGVQGGYFCYDRCGSIKNKLLMRVARMMTRPNVVYSNFAKIAIVPTMQWKDCKNYEYYQNSNNLLSQINGENLNPLMGAGIHAAIGRKQIVDLDRFITIYSPQDDIISPPQSGQFDYYGYDAVANEYKVHDFLKSPLFSSDTIGMKELATHGKWINCQVNNYTHRDFVAKKAEEFYDNVLKHLLDFSDSDKPLPE